MDQDQVEQQVVTFDAAAVAADEMGGRESVKNSFQCNECFKVNEWPNISSPDKYMVVQQDFTQKIQVFWEMDHSAQFCFWLFLTVHLLSDVQEPSATKRSRGRSASQRKALRMRAVSLPRLEKAAYQGETETDF